MAPLHVLFAPGSRPSALREKDPPTGSPPLSTLAMFATPWLTKSRSGSRCWRSFRANIRAIDAASAKPTTAMTSAGNAVLGTHASA
jgi:hypothetical protein